MTIIIYAFLCFIYFYIFIHSIKKFLFNNKIQVLLNKINMCYGSNIAKKNIIVTLNIILCHMVFFALIFNIVFTKMNIKYLVIKIISILFVYLLFYYLYGYGLLTMSNSKEYLLLILLMNIYSLFVFTYDKKINMLNKNSSIIKIIIFTGYGIMYTIVIKQIINSAFGTAHNKIRPIFEYIYYLFAEIYILFLGSCIIEIFYEGSYIGMVSYFDLFYYTIITFATIGFGDIAPGVFQSKIMSIIIALTSIITISSNLNRILQNRATKI